MIHPILVLTGHLFSFSWTISLFGDPREVIRGCSPPQNEIWKPWYIHYKIWYIIYKLWYIFYKIWYTLRKIWYILKKNLVHLILVLMGHLSSFPWTISLFGDPWEVIGSCSPPRNGFWQPWYIHYKFGISFTKFGIFFTKFNTLLKKFDTSNLWATGTLILSPIVCSFL